MGVPQMGMVDAGLAAVCAAGLLARRRRQPRP